MEHYDALVIGGGAVGGWAIKTLTESGLRVALLEAGPKFPTSNGDLKQPIQSRCVGFCKENSSCYVDDEENPYTTPVDRPFHWFRGRQLGGRMLTWGRRSFRMSDYEFKAASRDGYGEDWPLSYAELAPYYDQVEEFLGVQGSCDGLPQLPDGKFCPPNPFTVGDWIFQDALCRRWPDRRLIPARIMVGHHAQLFKAAVKTGRLTFIPNAVVSQITTAPGSRHASGVIYTDRVDHCIHEISGRIVVLCASTIESTRILLNSAAPDHPDGLANSSGVVGRYLMDHNFSFPARMAGIIPHRTCDPNEGSVGLSYIPNFRNLFEPHGRFIRGYAIEALIDRGLPSSDMAGFPAVRATIDEALRRKVAAFGFAALGETLPRLENRVTLDKNRKDAWGIPAAHIDFSYSHNEHEMVRDQLICLREMVHEAKFEPLFEEPDLATPGQSIHEVGTIRMGSNPKSSALNKFNQSWDVPNLFVTDGSCFVTAGSQNPTLTMMAITVRACDYIVSRLKRYEL